MSTVTLEAQLDLPCKVSIGPEMWIAAATLGRLRTVVNDHYRARERDRGRSKNFLNDLQGSLGELLGLQLLEKSGLSGSSLGLLDLGSSVNKPDLIAQTDPPTLLEVKCHLHEKYKRLFLVNERARLRSLERGVQFILPVVAEAIHAVGYVGKLIPVDQLRDWDLGNLGSFVDPARQLSLSSLNQIYFDFMVRPMKAGSGARWGPRVLAENSFSALGCVITPHTVVELQHRRFNLDGLSYAEVEQALLALWPPSKLAQVL